MLSIVDVEKSYAGVTVLDKLSLSLEAGEIVGLIGHNGAGKTTLVEIITGLVVPDGGQVRIDGLPPRRARSRLGVAPQNIALYPSITVREHLRLCGRLAGMGPRSVRAATEELALALGLTEILDRSAGVLSGGQQRRTQAATALIHRPPLLILDEPTAGADLDTRAAMIDLVKQRAGEGTAVLYTTHYLQELTDLQASIAVLRAGQVVARGSYDELVGGLPGEVRIGFEDGQEQRISTREPALTLMDLLRDAQQGVSSVEIHKPSLDDFYHSMAVTDDVYAAS